jgi:hypothetical protein
MNMTFPHPTAKLMQMYEDFEQLNNPANIIAKRGIHPEIVELEFKRFLKFKSYDPYDLQKKITADVFNAPPPIQSLVDKSTSTLLTIEELMRIIEFKMRSYVNSHLQNMVLNPTNELPAELDMMTCRVCLNKLPGVIYDKKTIIGSRVEEALGEFLCESCKLVREDLALHQDLVP